MSCPLCLFDRSIHFQQDKYREYLKCNECHLIYVPTQYHLSEEAEKNRYDYHENNMEDVGYQKFLSKIFDPMLEKIKPQSEGLDFGCGNGPVLAKMFEKKGHKMSLFDKFYFKDESVFLNKYDFIVSTEVFEHLHQPKLVLEKLLKLLNTKGILGIMTNLEAKSKNFSNWYYSADPTHICFYSEETFEWISSKYNIKLEILGNDLILLNV